MLTLTVDLPETAYRAARALTLRERNRLAVPLRMIALALAVLLPFGAATAQTAETARTSHHRHRAAKTPHKATSANVSGGVKVWVNTKTGVYHLPGTRWYGNTKEGKFIGEAAARAEGDRSAANGQ